MNDPVLNNLSIIYSLIAVGNKLFVGGYSYRYGNELYEGDATTEKFASISTTEETMAQTNTAFNAFLYPNPASSKATLQITGNAKNAIVTITDMSGKKLWQRSNSSTMLVDLPIQKLAPGIYMVTIISGGESKTAKLIKQ